MYLVTPPTLNVYKCYYINLNLLICWNHIDNVNISQQNYLLNILKLKLYPTGNV